MQFLAKKNEENRANMEAVMSGPKEDVLTRMLRGLSGAKVTKQGKFAAFDESPFLACNYKNDAGMASGSWPHACIGCSDCIRGLFSAILHFSEPLCHQHEILQFRECLLFMHCLEWLLFECLG